MIIPIIVILLLIGAGLGIYFGYIKKGSTLEEQINRANQVKFWLQITNAGSILLILLVSIGAGISSMF